MSRVRTVSLGVVDQASFVLASFGFTVLVARQATQAEFGAYALATAVVGFTVGLLSATLGVGLLILDEGDARFERILGDSMVASVTAGAALVAVAMVLASLPLTGPTGALLLASSAMVVPLGLAMALRMRAYRAGKPQRAAALSVIILISSAATSGLIIAAGDYPLLAPVLGQAFAAAIGIILYALVDRSAFSLADPRIILSQGRTNWRGLSAAYLAGQGVRWTVPWLVALGSSIAATAAMRGAQTLVNLGSSVYVGLAPLATRSVSRQVQQSGRPGFVPLLWLAGSALLGLSVVVITSSLPGGAGEAVLGQTWHAAQPLVMWVSLAFVGNQLAFSATLVMQAMRQTDRLAVTRAIAGAGTAAAVYVGALLGGAVGASVGLAVGSWLGGLVGVLAVRRGGVRLVTQ